MMKLLEKTLIYFNFVHACDLDLGGVFKLELFLPEEYPMAAPKVIWSDLLLLWFMLTSDP